MGAVTVAEGARGPTARRAVAWPASVAEVARSLSATGSWCWLDGEAGARDEGPGRSYLAAASEVLVAERGRERGFLSDLRAGLSAVSDDDGFGGGWVAAFSYEFGVALLGLEPAADDAPPAFALRIDTVLVLDHATGTAELRGRGEAELDAWIAAHGDALRAEIRRPADAPDRIAPNDAGSPHDGPTAAPRWRRGDARYEADVEACRAAIGDGDAYVLCLTDTAEIEAVPQTVDPLTLYLRLRERGAAVRGGVIAAGDRALVSASPERFLSLRGGAVATHPIKGTRPRDPDAALDRRLAAELAADPKERAENLMIVDLMRNDLSRVCAPGTVAVEGFLRVETHPRVHQLVSTVRGRIEPGRDALDLIEACFPGGSMTGAPKHRAVEILADLEAAPRGLYSGCFGWIDRGGDAELAMTIRGVELRGLGSPAPTARIGAGGGVTIDSDAARERAERDLKAAPLLDALSGPPRRAR